jgi:hypothetical protein
LLSIIVVSNKTEMNKGFDAGFGYGREGEKGGRRGGREEGRKGSIFIFSLSRLNS